MFLCASGLLEAEYEEMRGGSRRSYITAYINPGYCKMTVIILKSL